MSDPKELFFPDAFYHVFNRAVGNELLFKSRTNYLYFLDLASTKLTTYVKFYTYCLMPNHFHFLVQIKKRDVFVNFDNELNSEEKISRFVSQRFGNVFNAYAQAINKENHRKGSLFKNRFKRKRIEEERYLLELVRYIHQNPVEAGLCSKVYEWEFSSYNAIVSKSTSLIERDEVIKWFENLDNFKFISK